MSDWKKLKEDVRGMSGRFFYDAERGDIGYIAKDCDDKTCDCEVKKNADGDQDCSVSVFDDLRGEEHICESLAGMLNAVGPLLDENDSLRAEVERLRVLTLNPGATLHGSTIMEIADERNHLRQQLAAALAAKDEACDLAESLRAAVDRAEAWDQVHGHGDNPDVNYKHRIAALRSIGKDGGNE